MCRYNLFCFVPSRMVSFTEVFSLSVFIPSHFEYRWISLLRDDGSSTFWLPWGSRYTLTYLSWILSLLFLFYHFMSFLLLVFTLSLFTCNLFHTHISADCSPSLHLMARESADSCPFYHDGVVRESLPRFTDVIIACIFHFYLGYYHPNLYPVCHSPYHRNVLVHTF